MSEQLIDWDLTLIQKYNYSGPRHTSHPTTLEFSENYGTGAFLEVVTRYPERPLSLYIYTPLCHKLCYFCGCNEVVTRQRHKTDQCLDVLEQEIIHRAPLFAERHVSQLRWGGGTPTYLGKAQIGRLMSLLRGNFDFSDDAKISIRVDPREVELGMLDHLHTEGFNRLSMGIQDFNKEVQRLVNREQDEEFIFALLNHACKIGFTLTNIDLIYGLPKQTPESFTFTLKRAAELDPGRLNAFNYAHLPTLFVARYKTRDADLPSAQQKLDIPQETISSLTETGYQFIGMNHSVRPGDELAITQCKGALHRNFQGYTTRGDTDPLGMGVSVISTIGGNYAQNREELEHHYQQVDEQRDMLWRGIALTHDSCIRRNIIKLLICSFHLDYTTAEQQWDLSFIGHFAEDLKLLAPLAKDELADVDGKGIQVTPKGRLLIHNIRMCFDAYLRQKTRMQQLSRMI